jgi:hypothetical protein
MKLNDNELNVLRFLAEDTDLCFPFRSIDIGLDTKTIRRACRSLARKGLTECIHGLFDDDGEVAGSGYHCTWEGEKYINEK